LTEGQVGECDAVHDAAQLFPIEAWNGAPTGAVSLQKCGAAL
jgi:hypothetical protein